MSGLPTLLADLSRICSQNSNVDCFRLVADCLGLSEIDLDRALAYLRAQVISDADAVLTRSVETSTHVKWFLHGDKHDGLRVWLHDYSKWRPGISGFANSIHDHRYGFVSLILRGGYIERRWSIFNGQIRFEEFEYKQGDLNSVDSDVIHSLVTPASGTVTLVVQMPKNKAYSNVYRVLADDTYSVLTIYDLATRIGKLVGLD